MEYEYKRLDVKIPASKSICAECNKSLAHTMDTMHVVIPERDVHMEFCGPKCATTHITRLCNTQALNSKLSKTNLLDKMRYEPVTVDARLHEYAKETGNAMKEIKPSRPYRRRSHPQI